MAQYNKGEIWVREAPFNDDDSPSDIHGRNAGDIIEIYQDSELVIVYDNEGRRCNPSSFRKPTLKEIKAFKNGIKKVSDIKDTLDIEFKFKVGDFVRVTDSGWGLDQRYVGKEFTIIGFARSSSHKHPTYELSEQGSILRIAEQGIHLVTEPESLLKEAKRRYPVGTRYIPAHLINSNFAEDTICTIVEEDEFVSDGSSGVDISAGNIPKNGHNYSETLYRCDGNRWAKIVGAKEDNKLKGVTPSLSSIDEVCHYPSPHTVKGWMVGRSMVDIMRPYSQAVHSKGLWDSVGNVRLNQKDFIAGIEVQSAIDLVHATPHGYQTVYDSLVGLPIGNLNILRGKSEVKSSEFKPKLFDVPRI